MVWTDGQDAQIRRLRTEGASWDLIALQLGRTSTSVIERAVRLGLGRVSANAASPADPSERDPLPAGHPASWDAINRGTALQGQPFRPPGAIA